MFAFRIAKRAFVKLFGIAGFLLALIGGALIGYSALTGGGLSPMSLFLRLVEGFLGLWAIIAGVIIYTGPMRFGGILAVIGGIILIIITSFATPAILVFVAGIIGLVGAAIKPPWWKFWKR
ncbi:hypothetical protein E6H21_10715 [Candidatus Bathyarchaeota archaeon]|nr:MAG: hypothetical protein E6H21_10715 [Candidatus Bathyarchaeota archaeon]